MNHYEDDQESLDRRVPGVLQTHLAASRRRTGLTRGNLTPQEVAALLQGLRQGDAHGGDEPATVPSRPPAPRRERRCSLGLQKISHWWAAVTELYWPHF